MALETPPIHVLIVCFPVQGQINPLLRLAKRLASLAGFHVTFTTTNFAHKIINATDRPIPIGKGFLNFNFIDDDLDPRHGGRDVYLTHLGHIGRKCLPLMLRRLADEGRPVSCLINGPLVPWVFDVSKQLGIPIATMWTQSCACFLTFFHFYNKLVPFPTKDDPYTDVQIPSFPLLKWDEFHSFLHPNSSRFIMTKPWLAEFAHLHKPFCILIDTFDDLEHDIINFSSNFFPAIKSVGPLFKDPISSTRIRADQMTANFDCLKWLDTKPRCNVVYISMGTRSYVKQEQIDEIAHGILNAGVVFLWVMMPPPADHASKPQTLPEGFLEKVGDNGRVLEYCPQEKVLSHPAVGCFVTHCGWNSTMEALTLGVPMVTFPQWGDQVTNAKFLVDVFGVAVRMGRGELSDKVVGRDEVEKCIREATVGKKAEEMRRNALAWKNKAHNAFQQGGSSYTNLQGFVDEIKIMSGNAAAAAAAPGTD